MRFISWPAVWLGYFKNLELFFQSNHCPPCRCSAGVLTRRKEGFAHISILSCCCFCFSFIHKLSWQLLSLCRKLVHLCLLWILKNDQYQMGQGNYVLSICPMFAYVLCECNYVLSMFAIVQCSGLC